MYLFVVQFLFTTKNAQQKHILIELTKKTHGDDPPQKLLFLCFLLFFFCKKNTEASFGGRYESLGG